jgi:excisionase family DNA binding protein
MSLYFSPDVERAGAIISRHLTVEAAAVYSGYSIQYLRRLLRSDTLKGTKIGQVWLVDLNAFEKYIKQAEQRNDRRFGPRKPTNSLNCGGRLVEVAR